MTYTGIAVAEREKIDRLMDTVRLASEAQFAAWLSRNAAKLSQLEVKFLKAIHQAVHLENLANPREVFFAWIVDVAKMDLDRLSKREKVFYDLADRAMERCVTPGETIEPTGKPTKGQMLPWGRGDMTCFLCPRYVQDAAEASCPFELSGTCSDRKVTSLD